MGKLLARRLWTASCLAPVENPTTLKKARRDIARMMTILAQKQNVKS